MTVTLRIPQPRALALVAAVLAVLLAATTVALGATLNRNGGSVTAVRTVTADDYAVTTGTARTAVPGMQTTVSVPAGEDALLVITFSAVSQCFDSSDLNSAYCEIRVLVDGVGASPGIVIFDSASDGESAAWEANSMQFVHRVNASGPHTVTVHWSSDEPDGTFEMLNRTLTVLRSRIG